MSTCELWTDGSGTFDDAPGGWAFVLRFIDSNGEILAEREDCGCTPKATNNSMELTAILMGLRALTRDGVKVVVFSDSEYAINPFLKGWVLKWKASADREGRWRKGDFGLVANQRILELLLDEVLKHEVTFKHVKGHAKGRYPLNERCDELAGEQRRLMIAELEASGAAEMVNA